MDRILLKGKKIKKIQTKINYKKILIDDDEEEKNQNQDSSD